MPAFGSISRRDLIAALRKAGFEGPFAGGSHSFMARGALRVRVPNPHGSDIGRELLSRILQQIEMTREQWEAL